MGWSPRTVARWFVAPERGFREASSLRVGAVVVVVLCIVNAALASHAAAAVAGATVGETQVENPARPDDVLCEQAESGETFDQLADACENEPETVTKQYSTVTQNAASRLVTLAFLAPLVVWLAIGGLFAVVMGGKSPTEVSDRVALSEVLAVVGVGLAPAVLRYAGRTVAVEQSLSGRTLTPTNIEAAQRTGVDAMTPETLAYLAVVLVTVAWSAFVWRGGLRAVLDTESVRIDVCAVAVAALLAVPAVHPVYLGPDAVGAGLALFVLGLPAMAAPRIVERIELFFDLIGTRGEVELKSWRVALTQVIGLLFVLVSTLALGGLLLA